MTQPRAILTFDFRSEEDSKLAAHYRIVIQLRDSQSRWVSDPVYSRADANAVVHFLHDLNTDTVFKIIEDKLRVQASSFLPEEIHRDRKNNELPGGASLPQ